MKGMNKTTKQMLRWIVILFALAVLVQMFKGTSKYALHEIAIKEKNVQNLSELPYSLECVPGEAKGSPYTKDLTPGGVCGIQKVVYEQSDYEVVGGIGEPLI
jgi:hypothetical protein